ncbi:MAG: ATP-binding protein [FCB group bacterium]|jgi:PAS domain S-box-containing protein|nr:ATP-binding protein [FCB group bacterium]
MSESGTDMKALADAFELFTRTTQTMEESFRRLETRVEELDRELAEKNRELALTSDYLRSILNSMSDGVVAVDTDGVLTTFNRAACAILGFDAEESLGRPFADVFGRDFSAGPGRRVTELRSKDGKTVPVSEKDSPLSDSAETRIGTVKVFQDLTELESLREQVQRKDRLAAIGQMAATVAHEIRNPLGGLRGFAALLARDIEADDPRARLVEKILQGAKDLDGVVSQLLEYTRPLRLRLRPVSCQSVVGAAVGYVDTEGRVEIRQDIPEDLTLMVDADLMRQVFLNIVLNAVQAVEGAGEVWIAASIDGDIARVSVRDTGCGMTDEQLQHVFSPFYTTKEKGTGLGLALAAKIVESHGGSVEAQSTPGKGATFQVRIPRAD